LRKILFLTILIILLSFMGWRIYHHLTGAPAVVSRDRKPAVAVMTEPVQRKTMRREAEFTGSLMPASSFELAPKVAGRLDALHVNIGDTLRRGDLVAVLDNEEYALAVAQAAAELEVGRAHLAETRSGLDVAAREYERIRDLREQKVVSEAELDTAEAHYQAAEAKHEVAMAQIRQRQAALQSAEVRLSYTRIHATWRDGVDERRVAERFVDEGAMLSVNDPVISVVDIKKVIAVVYVIERDFPEIRIGQTAVIAADAWPDRHFEGRIIRKAPVLREESRQARVEIEIDNSDELLAPGMFVRARLLFAVHEDAVAVPVSALLQRNGVQGVFLADTRDMRARFIPVRTGIVSRTEVEILAPEIDGLVITLGQHLLEDHSPILITEEMVEEGALSFHLPDRTPEPAVAAVEGNPA
jgi:RND family efflux transporter MFP subunit